MSKEPESQEPSIDEKSVIEDLDRELGRVRAELEDYQGLIEELPSIYEGKFRHQLRDVAQDIRRLLDERQALQAQIDRALQPCSESPPLPPATPSASAGAPAATEAAPARRPGLIAALRDRLPCADGSAGPGRMTLLVLAVLSTLVVAGVVTAMGLWMRSRSPQLAAPGGQAAPERPAARGTDSSPSASRPDAAAGSAASPPDPGTLRLRARGECWLEVQTLDGETLLKTTLQGGEERSVSLGDGLRLLAGRPDLLELALGVEDFRTVGSIDEIDWTTIRPPVRPEGAS